METTAYFDDIHSQIIQRLEQAEDDITIAVAWFTDRDIFRVLCRRASNGIPTKLAILDDEINLRDSGLDFNQLTQCGGEMFIIPKQSSNNIMHHKFCVIDRNIVITGSYNWSKRARDNNEDIVIVTGAHQFAIQYLDTFNQILVANHHPVKDIPRVDSESIARRLELIQNLILLGEFSDIKAHLNKLRQVSLDDALMAIIDQLERQAFSAVQTTIRDYITRLRALVAYQDPEVNRLKQELLTLEFQVTAISDEKAEVERRINEFSHNHNLELGELIVEYFRLRALLLEIRIDQAIDDEEPEEEVEKLKEEQQESEDDYNEYQEEHERILAEDPIPVLTPEERESMKKNYRKASMLCHPDRVSDDVKEKAHEIFVELSTAYKNNDVEMVKKILGRLQKGEFFVDQSTRLSEKEAMISAINRLKAEIDALRDKLTVLKSSETYQTLIKITRFDLYFKEKKDQLMEEIATMQQEIEEWEVVIDEY